MGTRGNIGDKKNTACSNYEDIPGRLLWPTSAPQARFWLSKAGIWVSEICVALVGHNNFPGYLHNLNRWQISGYSQISSNFFRNGEFGNLGSACFNPSIDNTSQTAVINNTSQNVVIKGVWQCATTARI